MVGKNQKYISSDFFFFFFFALIDSIFHVRGEKRCKRLGKSLGNVVSARECHGMFGVAFWLTQKDRFSIAIINRM